MFSAFRRRAGLSVLEVILAIAVFSVLAAAVLGMVVAPLYSSGGAAGQQRGMYLGQEGIEAAKAIRNAGWNRLAVGAHGIAQNGGRWTFDGGSDSTPSGCLAGSAECYLRVVTVSEVRRDPATGDIATSGAVDPRTRLVESDVTWTTAFGSLQSLHYATYVTNWDNYSRKYDSDADFAGGTASGTIVSGAGDPAVITLGTGEAGFSLTGGIDITNTSDTDWAAGTYSGSVAVGSGAAASVEMKPTSVWSDYFQGSAWAETTETDFADGSPSGTTVADTGDLAAIVLNTSYDWTGRVAPTTAQANDVAVYSSSLAFAVGNGGAIMEWDGISWTSLASPVTDNLWGVAVLSSNSAWAVGESGKVLKWNGTAWSESVDLGSQAFREIRMINAASGFIVADGGAIFRWDGATWAADVSGTTDNLTAVAGGPLPTAVGNSVTKTSDTDFSGGAFANTAVSGTGSAASVVMGPAVNWAVRPSPTANQLNDTALVSATDGWAVGNGGVIARWNGTAWAAVTSPTAENLYGVACVTSANCWAAGASGKILRWNGTAWSEFVDLGSQVFRDVGFESASSGWATGDGGIVYRWNGTAWAADASNTAENLNGVSGGPLPTAIAGSAVKTNYADFSGGTFTNTATTGTSGDVSVDLTSTTGWSTLASATTSQLNRVDLYSSSLGFAVGNGGTVLRWNGTAWSVDTTFPNTDNVLGIDIVSATDAWASGANGRVWHWNGSTWTQYGDYGSQTWNDISCPDSTHCFMVGSNANNQIWRWTGSGAFTAMADPSGNQTWYGLDCLSATQCWSAGNSGQVGYMNGTTWTEIRDVGSTTLRDVSMANANAGYIVGDAGLIWRCSSGGCDASGEWTADYSGTFSALYSVSAVSSASALAVGAAGTVRRWNGSAWSGDTSSTGSQMNGVVALSADYAMAVGAGGTVIEYATRYASSGTFVSPTVDAGTPVSWGTAAWTATLPDGTALTVAYRTSADGVSWSSWSAELGASGSSIAGARTRYLQYRATLTTSVAAVTPTLDSLTVTWDASTPTLFAVSGSGTVMARNATSWAVAANFSGYVFRGVHCVSTVSCWAVADGGYIVRWNGTSWTSVASPTTQNLNAVYTVSSSAAFAVGAAGTALQWNGTAWSAMTSNTANALFGVAAAGASYAVAVGAGGTIDEYAAHYATAGTFVSPTIDAGVAVTWSALAWTRTLPAGSALTLAYRTSTDGATWSAWSAESSTYAGTAVAGAYARYFQYRATFATTAPLATPSLDSVTVSYDSSATTVYAVSSAGRVFGRNASAWVPVATFAGTVFRGLDCASATYCWAVGDAGAAVRLSGGTWAAVSTGSSAALQEVDVLSSSVVHAVGTNGTILLWNGTAWSGQPAVGQTSATTATLYGIDFVSASFGIAVGASGGTPATGLFEYGLHYAVSGTYTSSTYDAGVSQTWSALEWDKTTPSGAAGTTAVSQIVVQSSANGTTWSSSVTCTTSPCSLSSLAVNRYVRYVVTETTPGLNRDLTPRLESLSITYNLPLTYDYYDLYMASPTDGWAAGCAAASPWTSGSIAHWNGSGWSNFAGVASACYDGIGGSGANDVWAVNSAGTSLIHWNGSTWSTYTIAAGTTMNDVKCLNGVPGECRAAGYGANMFRWNGSTWTMETMPSGTGDIEWVSYVAANDVWAAASGGQVLHYNGSAWSIFATYGTTSWHGVYMLSATDGFMVGGNSSGDYAVMRRWNGSTWNSVTLPGSPTTYELQNVNCLNSDLCWATGGNGTGEVVILRWDGTSWSNWMTYVGGWTGTQTTPTIATNRIKAAWIDTTNHAWAVANNRVFLEFKSYYPSTATWVSPTIDSGAAGTTWNDIAWDTTRPSSTNVTLATRTSADGVTWSSWSGEYTEPGGTTIASPSARYLQYRATFTSGSRVATATLDEVRLVHSALTVKPLYDVAGTSASDIWVVGGGGFIGHNNGAGWTAVVSPTSSDLYSVAVLDSSLAFAVGATGRIVRWDGADWTTVASPTLEDLRAVEFVSAASAFAVGMNGTVLHWNGAAWAVTTSGTTADLYGLAMSDAAHGFAVGEGGAVLRWNGTAWATMASPTVNTLNAVGCSGNDFCAAVGELGTIIGWNGTAWSTAVSPVTCRLSGVGFQSGSDGWAVGELGTTLYWDGAAWANLQSRTTRNFYSVNYPGGGLAWVTGSVGSVLSASMTSGTNGTYTSAVLDTGLDGSVFLDAVFAYSLTAPAAALVQFRAGDTASPDSGWTAWLGDASLTPVVAIDPALSPHRYLQYRLTLTTSSAEAVPQVDTVTITYQ